MPWAYFQSQEDSGTRLNVRVFGMAPPHVLFQPSHEGKLGKKVARCFFALVGRVLF